MKDTLCLLRRFCLSLSKETNVVKSKRENIWYPSYVVESFCSSSQECGKHLFNADRFWQRYWTYVSGIPLFCASDFPSLSPLGQREWKLRDANFPDIKMSMTARIETVTFFEKKKNAFGSFASDPLRAYENDFFRRGKTVSSTRLPRGQMYDRGKYWGLSCVLREMSVYSLPKKQCTKFFK